MREEDHLRKGEKSHVFESLVSGAIAGLAARSAIAPLDTLKLRLQLGTDTLPHTLKSLIRHEGLLALWKGNLAGSIMYIIYGSVQFGTYSYTNAALLKVCDVPPTIHSTLAGAITGMASSLCSYPFDVLRTRLATTTTTTTTATTGRSGRGLYQHIERIYIREGLGGFFHGVATSMANVTVSTAAMFGTYEGIRARWPETNAGTAGAISGVISRTITFPLDTIRRRLQIRTSSELGQMTNNGYIGKHMQRSAITLCVQIVRDEGVKVLFRGIGLGLLKSVPNTAINLWVYENLMRVLT
ncbi:hypothetical protein Kpol_1018p133 [Vanderwaltozyma polyspora DSM 70294]|uniref:Mitochondrial thiamine pyrophosphate carrier 1 n=1 Tax=Vanderwaltozyma polyspora (strain ATCC 22028 / DSM 70294 / BCRC 21397 / CBS 2163 / NBRC 10782 / NRRL Y-8283 / UCD 57-17) TaxID=436907 RepID=TPC1_VANPO|nr:uncharacterized protein Kpol_1018p133 [Vanderwaltozyma polyspora DSM 70294]A7TDX5.1 RecName: Full=Mitochondrial thiamine pyrophosphate carrier 1 [Vanderwaltozyma polyspora DSM 70294]EDO19595.1 hypothetical protein Kpol_1018p133 [Vanderwaltozyma polyspora DSM 70294]